MIINEEELERAIKYFDTQEYIECDNAQENVRKALHKICDDFNIKPIPYNEKFNYIHCPTASITLNEDGANYFNEILGLLKDAWTKRLINRTIMTPSGGVSVHRNNRLNNSFSINIISKNGKITLLIICGIAVKLKIGANVTEHIMGGRQAWSILYGFMKDFGLQGEIEKFRVNTQEEAKEIKAKIPSYKIDVLNRYVIGRTMIHCDHYDLNSAFASGIAATYPQFKNVLEYIYSQRLVEGTSRVNGKEITNKQKYKAVLTNSIGYMQSIENNIGNNYFPELSRAAIQWTNDMLDELCRRLKAKGYIPILTNTDGVWALRGSNTEPYHDENEGYGLCQWKSEYHDSEIRVYSEGKYDFRYKVDDKWIYKPVVRGPLNIEEWKPREKWTWEEDVLRHTESPHMWRFDEFDFKMVKNNGCYI